MKVLKYLGISFACFVALIVMLGSGGNENSTTISKSNHDGSYTISYSESKCGNLGYQFKVKHQNDGLSSTSKTHKSNCKVNASGDYEGYIYPKTHPHMRIYWVETANGVDYQS